MGKKRKAESTKRKVEGKQQKVESLKPKVKLKKEVEVKATENPPAAEGSNAANDSFDFGGLPERNLKKNLGCG